MEKRLVAGMCFMFHVLLGIQSTQGSISNTVDPCVTTIIAIRQTRYVPVGGRITLHCKVQHCGVGWQGTWWWGERGNFTTLALDSRRQVSNLTLVPSSTEFSLLIQNISRSDAGGYQCQVTWPRGDKSNGHITIINVTEAGEAASAGRPVLGRLLVYAAASLCFPLVLALAWYLSTRQKRPQPTPTRSTAAESNPKEVVYASVTVASPGRHCQAAPQTATPSTIYSVLRFPRPERKHT